MNVNECDRGKERVYTRLLEADVFRHLHRWRMKEPSGRSLLCKVRALGTAAGCSWVLYTRCAPADEWAEQARDAYAASLEAHLCVESLVYTLWSECCDGALYYTLQIMDEEDGSGVVLRCFASNLVMARRVFCALASEGTTPQSMPDAFEEVLGVLLGELLLTECGEETLLLS